MCSYMGSNISRMYILQKGNSVLVQITVQMFIRSMTPKEEEYYRKEACLPFCSAGSS